MEIIHGLYLRLSEGQTLTFGGRIIISPLNPGGAKAHGAYCKRSHRPEQPELVKNAARNPGGAKAHGTYCKRLRRPEQPELVKNAARNPGGAKAHGTYCKRLRRPGRANLSGALLRFKNFDRSGNRVKTTGNVAAENIVIEGIEK